MDLSPVLVVALLGFLAFAWILSYLLERIEGLEYGARNIQGSLYLEDPSSLAKVPCPSIYDNAEKYISFIMPAYNEEVRLSVHLDELMRYLQQRAKHDKAFTYEVIIVDDGSIDRTVKIASEYTRKYTLDLVRVIKQGKNTGKGAAVKKGMLCARGRLLLMLDADGATKVTDVEKLEAEIRNMSNQTVKGSQNVSFHNLDDAPLAIFGSRAHLERQALATRKWYRNLLMKGFHCCVVLVAGRGVRDTQCGFKLFTRGAAQQLFANMRLNRWCFDVELAYLCKRLHIPICEVAVNWTEIPGSKVKFTSILHMIFELVLIRFGYGLQIWKIQWI